jgi:hypothetical protein
MRLSKWFAFRAGAPTNNIQVPLVIQHNSNHLLISWMCDVMLNLTVQVRKLFHHGFLYLASFLSLTSSTYSLKV